MSLTSRRSLLVGLFSAAVAAPAVIRSGVLMPISLLKLPKMQYVRAFGPDAGAIEMTVGSTPKWAIPCDGRLVSGFDYPELFVATRGYEPSNRDDDWLHIVEHESHPFNPAPPTIDYYTSIAWPLDEPSITGATP